MRLKSVLVIGDGMADWPLKELGWKTPLEAAHKPSLNPIAKSGICGITDVISPGVPPAPYVRRDNVEEYDERACAKGGLNRIRGKDLMPILMNLLDKTKKFGA